MSFLAMHPTESTQAESSTGRTRPIRLSNLPVEVLGEIFTVGYEDENQNQSPWPKGKPFEILVSHISQHCRAIAHDTARLWTSIDANTRVAGTLDIAAGYIERSKNLLVDVRVRLPSRSGTDHTSQQARIRTLLNILSPHSGRLESLKVEGRDQNCIECVISGLQYGCARLKVLDIRHFGYSDTAWRPGAAFRDGLPKLQSLKLIGVDLGYLSVNRSITILQLHGYYAHALHTLRSNEHQSFTFLTHLIIKEADVEHWNGAPGYGSFDFPSLKVLNMRSFPHCARFLSDLVAPQLETLYLATTSELEMAMADVATASFEAATGSPKFPSMRHLIVHILDRRWPPLPPWYHLQRCFPDITHVWMLNADAGDFLESLLEQDDSTVPWMALDTLSMPNAEKDLIAETLTRRAAVGHPIRKLQVSQAVYDDEKGFFQRVNVVVEVVENAHTGLPVIGSSEDWEDLDDLDRGCDTPTPEDEEGERRWTRGR